LKLLNKKNSSSGIKKKVTPIIESFGRETHKFIEDEFNNSKYVTSHRLSDDMSKNYPKKPKKELVSPHFFKFKRRSYLSEAITKEDLNDPNSFEYALKKITHTHVEKLVK